MDDVRVNGYRCTHPAVLELVRQDGTGRSVEDIVCEFARTKLAEVDALLQSVDDGWAPPPFDPFLIAQALGIRCVATDCSDLQDSMLVMQDGLPTVVYRKRRAKTRIRFSVFHELAHTLFPGYEQVIQHRKTRRFAPFEAVGQLESLCDLVASEMLMPTDLFGRDLETRGFGADQVTWLGRRYGASLEAVCIRMVALNPAPCAMAHLIYRRHKPRSFERKYVPGENGGVMKNMRVVYAATSEAFRGRYVGIPKYLAVPGKSCIHAAAWENCATTGEETLNLGSGPVRYRVETLPLSFYRRRGLYSPVCAFFYPMSI